MKRQKIKTIVVIVGFILFLAEVLLGALSLYSVMHSDSTLILEFHPVGGMDPHTFNRLLWIFLGTGWLCLFFANFILPVKYPEPEEMKRHRTKGILWITGFFLVFVEILLVVLSPYSTLELFIDSSVTFEFYPIGGMPPQIYYALIVLVFFAAFLSLLL